MPLHSHNNKYHFTCLADLAKVGIYYLTGEADGLSMRLLFDFTEYGRRLICKTFGLLSDTKFSESWNRGHDDDQHVGSIFLAHDQCWPIMVIACFEYPHEKLYGVVRIRSEHQDDMIFAVTNDEIVNNPEYINELREVHKHVRVYSLPGERGQPVSGLSSVHAATGRAM